MKPNAAPAFALLVAFTLIASCCCSSTPEAEPAPGPDGTDTAGWEGSTDGRPPVVIYPEQKQAPAVPGNQPAVAASQPIARPAMDEFLAENRRLRSRVEQLNREVDGMRAGRAAATAPVETAPVVAAAVPAAAPVRSAPSLSVEQVRAVLASAGAGQIQVATNAQNEVYLTLPGSVSFGPGKADLKSSAQTLLTRAVSALKSEFPGMKLRVEGHTDSDPIRKSPWPSNMALSKARAEAVGSHIVRSSSLTPAEVASVGFGETRPMASNATREGKAQNRRSEIVLIP